MMRKPFRRRGDEGVSLVIAIAFVLGVGLVSGSLLTYSATAIRSEGFTLAAQQNASDVAGGLQAAVNDVRNSDYFNNVDLGQQCFTAGGAGSMVKLYPASGANGTPVTVTCTPDPGSGAVGGLVPVNDTNKPSVALLTLGTSPSETGLLKQGNSVLKIRGSVYSNSTIGTANGTDCAETPQPPAAGANCSEIYVEGAAVIAEEECEGRIVASGTGGKHCDTGTHAVIGNDPATLYPSAYTAPATGLTPRTLPSCSAGSRLVTFEPGYYDDAVGLSELTTGAQACKNHTFWFQPGVYYFDFHNAEMPTKGSPVVPDGSNVWTIDDSSSSVIGGTRRGWTTDASIAPDRPGACVSPLTSTTASGVQFVFGGDSQVYMRNGYVELCGTWYSNKPPITLYGAKSAIGTSTTATLVPSHISSHGAPSFTGLNPVSAVGSSTDGDAGPVVTGVGKNETAVLDVTEFSGLSAPVEERAVLQSAVLRVRHGERGANAGTNLRVSLTPNRTGAEPITRDLVATPGAALTFSEQSFDLTSALASELYAFGLSGNASPFTAAVTLSVDSAGQSVDEQVDYVSLELEWMPIGVRAQSGCVTAVNGCSVIGTNPQGNKELYILGTGYLPRAKVDLTLNNISSQVFRCGLVVRVAELNITASSGFNEAVIELPDNAFAPTPLVVFFTAWECPPGNTCSLPPPATPWRRVGRAQVRYTDGNFIPVSGQRQVNVLSWNLTP